MAKRNFTDEELDAILNSLDGLEKAAPRPYFYTRLMSRMQVADENNSWSRAMQFISKPAIALGMTLIFLLINAYIIFNQFKQAPEPLEESTQTLALEYNSLNTSFYENNADNP